MEGESRTVTQGNQLYRRARRIIPGGTQLLSKRPELYAPGFWPPYAESARGCRIEDIDGNEYIDMTTMGIGTCLLGYADPVVNAAVARAVEKGSMCSLNVPEEVALAERLLELHPWAGMVRFARTGGEMLSVAVRIARAATGRDGAAFCGYHGWSDWYLASNLSESGALDGHLLPGLDPAGVPRGLTGTIHPFHYNAFDELERLLDEHDDVGTVIMEPLRFAEPKDGFLTRVRELTARKNLVLIFDEVTAGWRHTGAGSAGLFGVEPDIAVYAKAMGNGFPCAAAVGRDDVMDAAQKSFISSTYWTERVGFAAACATLEEFRRRNVPAVLADAGTAVQELWKEAAEAAGVPIAVEGRPALTHFTFLHPQAPTCAALLTGRLLELGYLGTTAFYASCAHTPEVLYGTEGKGAGFREALHEAFGFVGRAIEEGDPARYLKGPPPISGFARLT